MNVQNYIEPTPLVRVPRKKKMDIMTFNEAFQKGNCDHCKNHLFKIEMTPLMKAGTEEIVRICQPCFKMLLVKGKK